MSGRTVSIIYLIIIVLCFIAMSLCKLPNANGYNVEENVYIEEKLRFENSSRFKNCVMNCITSTSNSYVWDCMDCLDCATCVDKCYEEHKPNLFLVNRIFNDIDDHTFAQPVCFINNLQGGI